jgi:hypothetical protein
MAWVKRGEKAYFYRSVRREGRTEKIYYGAGPTGKFAAAADALRRAENKAEAEALRTQKDRLDVALTRELYRGCALLAAAALLTAGYHRPVRHPWRPWRHGRKILKQPH